MRRSLFWGIVTLLAGLAVACGGDAAVVATPAAPVIDARLQSLGQGSVVLDIAPGAKQDIEPLALARQAGTPPTCADFVFVFSWDAGKNASLSFSANLQGGQFDVAKGAQGQASVTGCVLLEASNDGSQHLRGSLRYAITQAQH